MNDYLALLVTFLIHFHSFIRTISIAPLLSTTTQMRSRHTRILCRNFTPKCHRQLWV